MKPIKYILTLVMLWSIGATCSLAQDFRLLMSRSIMEMPDYKKATAIDKITDWIEVSDGGIYSNFMEVNDFLQKMKTPGLKGLDEANQFRRMRDRTILTFKFEDEGEYNSYNVVAKHGNIIKKLTTSKYFFMNVPMSDKPVELTVSSIYFPDNAIHIKCQSVPFGNDSLYVFQLDKGEPPHHQPEIPVCLLTIRPLSDQGLPGHDREEARARHQQVESRSGTGSQLQRSGTEERVQLHHPQCRIRHIQLDRSRAVRTV